MNVSNPNLQNANVILIADGTNMTYNPLTNMKTNIDSHLKQGNTLATISLTQFQCNNTFLNVSAKQGNNTLKTISVYGSSSNVNNDASVINQITVPDGYYTMDNLLTYLNGQGLSNVAGKWYFPTTNSDSDTGKIFNSAKDSSSNEFQGIYIGAGYDPTAISNVVVGSTPTKEALVANLDEDNPLLTTNFDAFTVDDSNIVRVRPPPKNIFLKNYVNGNSVATDPFVMKYFGLVDDTQTSPLNKVLGFNTANVNSVSVASTGQRAFLTPVQESYNASETIDENPTVAASQAYNLGGTSRLYFCITNLNNQNYSNIPIIDNTNCVAVIPVTADYGDIIDYQPQNPMVSPVANQNLDTLDVVIFDEYYRTVDFNGVPWTAVINFTFHTNSHNLPSDIARGGQSFTPPDIQHQNRATYHLMNQKDTVGHKRSIHGLLSQF